MSLQRLRLLPTQAVFKMASRTSSTHIAALAPGKAEKLILGSLPTPNELQPHEMLVDVKAVSINPVDWKARDWGIFGNSFEKPWPQVLGVDAAGIVLSTGADVKSFRPGDRVAGYVRMNRGALIGSFQSRTTLWSTIAIHVPDSLSFADGATLPLAYSTATVGLNLDLGIPLPGEKATISLDTPVLILGGAAAIGQMCLQLLKFAGFTNVISTASESNHELIKSLGATTAFDQRTPPEELATKIEEAAGGKLKYIYDVISAESTVELARSVVEPEGGRVVLSMMQDIDDLTGANLRRIGGTTKMEFPGTSSVIGTFGGRVFDASASAPYDGKKPQEYDFGQRSWAALSKLVNEGRFRTVPVHVVEGGDLAEKLETGLRLSKEQKLGGRKAVVLLD